MKNLVLSLIVIAIAFFGVRTMFAPGGPDLAYEGDEVRLATGDLEVRFSQGESFDDTYMIFGGGYLDHPNAISNVTVAGFERPARRTDLPAISGLRSLCIAGGIVGQGQSGPDRHGSGGR